MPRGIYPRVTEYKKRPNEVKPPRMGCEKNGFKPCWEYCPYPKDCGLGWREKQTK